MKNNKGVTLVALVITIIVLIILAAVSLATLTGDNNIFTRAEQAKEDTEKTQTIELINTALFSIKTEVSAEVVAGNTKDLTTFTKDTLGLDDTFTVDTSTASKVTISKTVNGTTYTGTFDTTSSAYGVITPAK